jgi:hypothetical protein
MAQFNFDTNSVEKRENSYELLPAGDYIAQVTDSAIAPLKSGQGQGLKLTVSILQEGYNGRKVFCNLNVQHTNPTTEQISQQQLRELCDSIGVVRMQDTVELHNKPFTARVKIRKGGLRDKDRPELGNYEDQNEISGFKPATVGARPAASPAFAAPARPTAAPAAAAATAGAASPPWAKKAA